MPSPAVASTSTYRGLATVYDRARPSYPDALIDAIVRRVGVGRGAPVADLGAGTGKLTRALARRGFRVSAVEPEAEMRTEAPTLPGVAWSEETFESTRLQSRSQRWVVAAQAFHRARLERALPEIQRVLVPGGWFTAMWYVHDIERSPILQATYRLLRHHVPAYRYRDRTRRRHRWPSRAIAVMPERWQRGVAATASSLPGRWRPRVGRGLELLSTRHFVAVAYDELEHCETVPAEHYLDMWKSRSVLRSIADGAAFDAFLAELREHLSRTGRSEVRVPYVFGAWSARAP